MNEQIKELALQAGITVVPEPFDDASRSWNNTMEKFAELIVKECIETLRLVPYNSDREFGDEAIYQEAITEHFKVDK